MPENGVRDNAAREATLNRLREALQDDVGGRQADVFEDQIDAVETTFARDRDRPHRQIVKKDEFEKVQEINGEYLDAKLELYLTQSLNAEQEYQERKYGRGPLGRVKRFAKETFWGQALTFGVKMTGGILCHVGTHAINVATAGAGSPLTPLLIGLGNQLIVDSVAGAAQYGLFERGRIQQLRNSRTQRVNSVLRAMQIRNALNSPEGLGNPHDKSRDIVDGRLNVDGSGEVSLSDELNAIISNLDTVEGDIIQQEQDLARVSSIGNGVRGLLKAGVAGASLYHALANGGIGLGMHDFDGNGTPHKVVLNLMNFLGFERAPGVLGAVGNVAPWGAIAAVGAGTVGALGYNVGLSVSESIKQRQLEQNPKEAAVFSLRGRTELGNAQNEISQLRSVEPGATVDKAAAIREAKAGMEQVGSVWRWTRDEDAETFISKGFNAEGGLRYVLIDPATGAEGAAMIYSGEADDQPFGTAKNLGNSIEGYKNSIKVDETVKRAAEERGVNIPERGQLWAPGSPFSLTFGLNTVNLTLENRIKIHDLRNNSREVYVQVTDGDGNLVPGAEGWVSTETIIRNTKAPEKKERKAGENKYKETLESIKQIFEDRHVRPEFSGKKLVQVGPDWYYVAEINEQRGYLSARKLVGAGPATPAPTAFNSLPPETINFEDFETLIQGHDGAGEPWTLNIVDLPAGAGGKKQ